MISCIILYGSLLKNVKSQNARLINNCSNKFLDGGSNKTTKEAMLKIVPSIDAMLARAPSNMIVQILASTGIPHVSGYILEMHSSSAVVFIGIVFGETLSLSNKCYWNILIECFLLCFYARLRKLILNNILILYFGFISTNYCFFITL